MTRFGLAFVTPQTALGVCIAILGLVFTLDNLGIVDSHAILRYWPVLPIGIGLLVLLQAERQRDWVIGTLWMAAGALFLSRSLGVVSFRLHDFLPLLLVLLGLRLIAGRARMGGACRPGKKRRELNQDVPTSFGHEPLAMSVPDATSPGFVPRTEAGTEGSVGGLDVGAPLPPEPRDSGFVNAFIVMGGIGRRVANQPFRGAELTAIMGGCELDLRHATIEEQAVINAFTMWGGIEIRVPPTWNVINEATAFMGGADDTTRQGIEPGRPRLVLRGFALMGGIEVKN